MLLSYYTLRALSGEWDALLRGGHISEVFSQARSELAISIERDGGDVTTLIVRLGGPLRFLMVRDDFARARKNVASIFESTVGARVQGIRTPERDRHLYVDLTDNRTLHVLPFGPRPNVFLNDDKGTVIDAFLSADAWRYEAAPKSRPAPVLADERALQSRLPDSETITDRDLARAVPLFDRVLAREVLVRAGMEEGTRVDENTLELVWDAVRGVESDLATPAPRVYSPSGAPAIFSLIPLTSQSNAPVEAFETTTEAVRVFVRLALRDIAFSHRAEPLRRTLQTERDRLHRSVEKMKAQQNEASRADRYEHWAHLIMAMPESVTVGSKTATLPDIFARGEPVEIPLNPVLSPIQNANLLYEKARNSREARTHAEKRLDTARTRLEQLEKLVVRFADVGTLKQMRDFEEANAEILATLRAPAGADEAGPRFRRFVLDGSFEVLVGKNAAQNDQLTFRVARPHDLWLHARGVPGSHVVLRLPGKSSEVPRQVRERAASIAAFYSRDAGSHLVPVIITQRKYVRKSKRGAPGAVRVEREEVLIVPPRLPG